MVSIELNIFVEHDLLFYIYALFTTLLNGGACSDFAILQNDKLSDRQSYGYAILHYSIAYDLHMVLGLPKHLVSCFVLTPWTIKLFKNQTGSRPGLNSEKKIRSKAKGLKFMELSPVCSVVVLVVVFNIRSLGGNIISFNVICN